LLGGVGLARFITTLRWSGPFATLRPARKAPELGGGGLGTEGRPNDPNSEDYEKRDQGSPRSRFRKRKSEGELEWGTNIKGRNRFQGQGRRCRRHLLGTTHFQKVYQEGGATGGTKERDKLQGKKHTRRAPETLTFLQFRDRTENDDGIGFSQEKIRILGLIYLSLGLVGDKNLTTTRRG